MTHTNTPIFRPTSPENRVPTCDAFPAGEVVPSSLASPAFSNPPRNPACPVAPEPDAGGVFDGFSLPASPITHLNDRSGGWDIALYGIRRAV